MSTKQALWEKKDVYVGGDKEYGVIRERKKGRSFVTFSFRVVRNEERENNLMTFWNNKANC